ncbi:MAG: ABC transporter substrate-binding protein [Acidimicrobiia bacterium]
MKHFLRATAALVIAALLAAACGGDDDDGGGSAGGDGTSTTADTGGSTGSGSELDRDAELRLATLANFTGWDPHRVAGVGGPPTAFLLQVYDRLVTFSGADMEVVPMLATSWEFSDDLKSLTLSLRDDVVFHDGSAFDAEVAKANLERAAGLLPSNLKLTTLQSVTVVDDTTVRLDLSAPDGTILDKLGTWAGAMVSGQVVAQQDINANPAGSGPYVPVVASSNETQVVYERNDDYWDPEGAKVARVTVRSIPDELTRLNAFRAGELDLTFFSPATYPDLEGLSDAEVETYESISPLVVAVNTKSEPGLTPEVLKALSLGIDRATIGSELFYDQCPAQVQPFAPTVVGYQDGLDDLEYDADEARAQLEQAGGADLSVTMLVAAGLEPYASTAQVLQSQWQDLGLDVELTPLPGAEVSAAFGEGRGDTFTTLLIGGPSPAAALNSYQARSAGYLPQSIIDARAEADTYELDSDEAQEAWAGIGSELAESPVAIPVCRPRAFVVSRPGVVGGADLPWLAVIQNMDWSALGVSAG